MVAEHITNIPCDKHSGKRAHTQMLIVHSIESPLANGYAVSMANNWLGKWYQANGALIEASSNVIVSPDTLVRSVHTDYAAWHASWANSLSVGYEQSGYAAYTRDQWLTPGGRDQIDRLAREMALDAAHYGIPLRWLTAAEVNAIRNGDRAIKGLVTHAVIDPSNRTDPGSQYPYDVLLASIKAYSGETTPQSGTITPIQEDDELASAADAIRADINTVHTAVRDNATATNKKIAEVERIIRGDVATVHNTIIRDVGGQLAGLREAFSQVAGGEDIDFAKVEAAAKAGAEKALAEGTVKVDVSIAGGTQ